MLRPVVYPPAVSSPLPPTTPTRHLLAPPETTQLGPASAQNVWVHQGSYLFEHEALHDEQPKTIMPSGHVLEAQQSRLQEFEDPRAW